MRFHPSNPVALVFGASLFLAVAAHADVSVRFIEGAPKDRFNIVNGGACSLRDATVTIDLSTSAGGLIFDTTPTGQGVEVFQPFEIVQGASRLARMPVVQDGEAVITLEIASLEPQGVVAFTIDVDDTLGQRAITVSGAEILGATARYSSGAVTASAGFDTGPEAVIVVGGC